MRKKFSLSEREILFVAICTLIAAVVIIFGSQYIAEQNAFTTPPTIDVKNIKAQREIDKLAAEIRQIRSDTAGSLFWLKLLGVFVTVGGAVGGYLIGLSRTTQARLEFENRKNVDTVYQSIIQELSDNSPILRACAAVKLGTILESFPHEWSVEQTRQEQMIQLSKQVLAASLAIENDSKVLKTISTAIVLNKPSSDNAQEKSKANYADLKNIDLSNARASDAYWARVDFSYADFYRADLRASSFRSSLLYYAQFREAKLNGAVLAKADCEGANFKLADLREADLTETNLVKTNFEGAKVYGIKLRGAKFRDNSDVQVDVSPNGDGSSLVNLSELIKFATP